MITPTAFLHDAYVRNGFYPENLHKIHFGIDLDVVKPFRKNSARIPSPLTFGYIGQITPHKGVDLVVEAFAGLQADNVRLLIFGPRDQQPGYMAQIEKTASGNSRIQFRDTFPADRLGQVLSEIDVLVIPSRWYENSPLVMLYALASKTPVIATDMKGMSEFVIDGWNGYTFQKDSMSALLGKMKRLADCPELWRELCKNADYAKGVMDHAREVEEIYRDILGAGDTSAGKAAAP
jgi:glycosyltransferase involved in cell wall biosynthesis